MAGNGSCTNCTELDSSSSVNSGVSAQTIVQAVVLAICSLLIVASNTFILLILHQVRNCFDDVQQFIFKMLAVTDFLTGIFCCGLTMLAVIFGVTEQFSSSMCAVRGAACTGFTNLSALLITCACFDRFIAVIYPLRYPTLVTGKRVKIVVLVVCGIAIFNGGLSTLRGRLVAKGNLCLADFTSERLAFRPSLVMSLLTFSVTLALSVFFNGKVMYVATIHSMRTTTVTPADSAESSARREKEAQDRRRSLKGLRVLIVATVTFFIALFPWSIIAASQFSRDHNFASPMARYVSSVLLISNSWMNAGIFLAFNARFRRAARRIVSRRELDGESTIGESTLNTFAN